MQRRNNSERASLARPLPASSDGAASWSMGEGRMMKEEAIWGRKGEAVQVLRGVSYTDRHMRGMPPRITETCLRHV